MRFELTRMRVLATAVLAAALAAIAFGLVGSSANAAKGVCKDGSPPPCKPGGSGEETATNNLSVPTVFIGSAGFGLTDPALQDPTGAPARDWDGAGIDPTAYYYVQGVNTWQAEYVVQATDTATAKWGDNLTGEASLKAGHPIRVEMGLTSDTVTDLEGFTVVKLQNLEDRNSAYGTLAAGNPTDGFAGLPGVMPARVWVAGADLSISDPSGVVTTVAMPGEINATGAPVFGYNWRPSEPGRYTLTFRVPEGTVTFSNPGDTALDVTVKAGGGGGGGKP